MADSKDDPIPRPPARPAVPPFRGPSGTPISPLRPITPSERATRPPFMPPPVAGRRPATPVSAPVSAKAPPRSVAPPPAPTPVEVALPLPGVAAAPPATQAPAAGEAGDTLQTAGAHEQLPSIHEFVSEERTDHELPEPTWEESNELRLAEDDTVTASDEPAYSAEFEAQSVVPPSDDEGIETYDDALGFGASAYDVSLPAEAALQDTSTYPTAGLDLSAFAEEPPDQSGEYHAVNASAEPPAESLTEWEPRASGSYPTGEAEIYAPEPAAAWESSTHASPGAGLSPTHAAADALESVARRVRRGELSVQDVGDDANDAAVLAAVLLALIRQRR